MEFILFILIITCLPAILGAGLLVEFSDGIIVVLAIIAFILLCVFINKKSS